MSIQLTKFLLPFLIVSLMVVLSEAILEFPTATEFPVQSYRIHPVVEKKDNRKYIASDNAYNVNFHISIDRKYSSKDLDKNFRKTQRELNKHGFKNMRNFVMNVNRDDTVPKNYGSIFIRKIVTPPSGK